MQRKRCPKPKCTLFLKQHYTCITEVTTNDQYIQGTEEQWKRCHTLCESLTFRLLCRTAAPKAEWRIQFFLITQPHDSTPQRGMTDQNGEASFSARKQRIRGLHIREIIFTHAHKYYCTGWFKLNDENCLPSSQNVNVCTRGAYIRQPILVPRFLEPANFEMSHYMLIGPLPPYWRFDIPLTGRVPPY